MQKSCPMSPERSSNYIPPHTFYPSTTDISAISATFYMSEERSWDFQSSWSIGALHVNIYSKTHLPSYHDALATHSGRTVGGVRFLDLPVELSLAHPWCQRHTGQPHPRHQGGHEEQVWLAILINFTFFCLQTLTFVVTHLKWRLRTTRYQESCFLLVIHWIKLLLSGCILRKHKENMQ